jgi:hypothetical protein
MRRGPYQKQADGSWKKLKDPADKGGDDNVYYEDKWAMIWNINNSIANFDKKGCAVFCHLGEGKPYGNKYTKSAGMIGDMWHMKGSRTAPLGKVDDQYLDHTRFDAKASPNAGRKSDGGPNTRTSKSSPASHRDEQDGKPGNVGGTYYIVKGDSSVRQREIQGGRRGVVLRLPVEGYQADTAGRQQVEQRCADVGDEPQARHGQQARRQFSTLPPHPFGFGAGSGPFRPALPHLRCK